MAIISDAAVPGSRLKLISRGMPLTCIPMPGMCSLHGWDSQHATYHYIPQSRVTKEVDRRCLFVPARGATLTSESPSSTSVSTTLKLRGNMQEATLNYSLKLLRSDIQVIFKANSQFQSTWGSAESHRSRHHHKLYMGSTYEVRI